MVDPILQVFQVNTSLPYPVFLFHQGCLQNMDLHQKVEKMTVATLKWLMNWKLEE